ncbi:MULTISPECIES: hypothetical protein [unclassified Streptomyces]|uniref:hypothetical protein n=1 Tax=unclassified Streptomyces TaxID=2593676 RepID=UPI002E28352C|nr:MULTISPECIES: hypothetical protein [unclassified Streptomyces]
MTDPEPDPDPDVAPDALFEDIAADLAPRGVTTGAMFGARALKARGKVFACLNGDTLAVKLGAGTPAHTKALSLPGVELFDPSGAGHPFKDWVVLPAGRAEHWPHYAERGLAALGG